MNIKSFYTSGQHSEKDLYDRLFFTELGLKEITNNDEIMLEFTSKIEEAIKMKNGYFLFSIDIKNQHHVVMLCKSEHYGESYNFCYIAKEKKDIDTGTSFTVEDTKDTDIYKYIHETSRSSMFDELDIVSLLLTKTMMGYRINLKRAKETIGTIEKINNSTTTAIPSELSALLDATKSSIRESKINVRNKFRSMKEKYELPITGSCNVNDIISDISEYSGARYHTPKIPTIVAKIDDVYNINNKRYAIVSFYDGSNAVKREVLCFRVGSNNNSKLIHKHDNYRTFTSSHSYESSLVNSIEYNYIDKGRYITIVGNGHSFKFYTVFQDPKIEELSIEQIIKYNETVIDAHVKSNIHIDDCRINIEDDKGRDTSLLLMKYVDNTTIVNQKEMQKALKSMYNEYNYVVKKNKSEGDDVKITDNLTYYHDSGKLEYNDFAIEVNLESLKQSLYNQSKEFMVRFFRKEITEEQIIEFLTEHIYKEIDYSVQSTTVENSFAIKFNNSVNVTIDVCKGGNNFTYINDNRVNKNEISSILREISCYNSQDAADMFITNITKRGLSVFIGLSSGYFHGEKYYKFKTTDKTNEYAMNIDGVEVNIKGKKIFNTLFSIAFKDERKSTRSRISDSDYINNHVFGSVQSKFDYIKYKIMIDKSYELFIDKSKKFLDKKIEDVGAEKVNYYDVNQNHIYDGLKVTGTSGKTYIIAYDLKESFVFMSPDSCDRPSHNELPMFEGGTYICMIDQSKMKATVGYDTVVSKLLSLKNDSVIASTIYNLEDELNK